MIVLRVLAFAALIVLAIGTIEHGGLVLARLIRALLALSLGWVAYCATSGRLRRRQRSRLRPR